MFTSGMSPQLLSEILCAEREVEGGHYIRDDIRAWLLSWGSTVELPQPDCVCGKRHDDEAS
jgi:hypothetical protein